MSVNDAKFMVSHVFGHVEVQQRARPIPFGLQYQGRSLHFDKDGNLTKTTEWSNLGRITWAPDPKPGVWPFAQWMLDNSSLLVVFVAGMWFGSLLL